MFINSKNVFLAGTICLLAACASVEKQRQPVGGSQTPPHPPIKDTKIVIGAVGDIMLGGSSVPYLERNGYDYPFVATRHLYRVADIVIGNLETSLTNSQQPFVDKKYVFKNPPDKVAAALKTTGFDIVSLANNHTMDYGLHGLDDTLTVLDKYGIHYHGAGVNQPDARKPVFINTDKGVVVAFLAYSLTYPKEFWAGPQRPGTAFGNEAHIREDIREIKHKADIIVVSFHWGRESTTTLRPYQPRLAHIAIDEGADLVIGHHPHIVQAVEKYKTGLILYSLGNYTFGSFSNRVNYSMIANIQFENGKFQMLEMTPINVNNFQIYFQPQPITGAGIASVFEDLYVQSFDRGTFLERNGNTIRLYGGMQTIGTQTIGPQTIGTQTINMPR